MLYLMESSPLINPLLKRARELIDAGFSVIPVKGKHPTVRWEQYQHGRPMWHGNGQDAVFDVADGLAVICGKVSGNLECLDFDDPHAFEQFKTFAPKEIVDKCYYQITPSGGSHLVYRCEQEVEGNKKLARDEKGQVRIETRGEGGYFLVPPSPGYHTADEYFLTSQMIPLFPLSTSERETLHRFARIFDEYIDSTTHKSGNHTEQEGTPGTDFNRRGDSRPILLKHGWTHVGTRTDGVELWERAGKDEQSVSATLGIGGTNLLYVFSSNAHPFEPDHSYTPFAVYALLECKGDFVRAAGELAAQGYGSGEQVEIIEEWEQPAPIVQRDRPEFPLSTLPTWLQEFVRQIEVSLEVPVDMPAMLALGVVSACISKRVTISPKADWEEPTNLYVVVAMPPAATKSGVVKILQRPIFEFEKNFNNSTKVSRQVGASKVKSIEKQIAKKTDDYALLSTQEERVLAEEELKQLYEEYNDLKKGLSELTLVVKDITPEMLTKKLSENGGKLAVIDDEAGLFGMMSGRYSSGQTNIDVYLTGHSGGDLRVSRISREDDVVENPALTLVLSVQPGAMEGLTLSSEFRDRGLLGRFLFCYPYDNIGERACANRSITEAMRLVWTGKINQLLSDKEPLPLVYSPEAEEYYWDQVRKIERRLGHDGDLYDMRDWGGKLRGQVARLSAVLHCLQSDPGNSVVSLDTLKNAWGLADYLIEHAKIAFAEMGYDVSVRKARRIITYLERHKPEEVSKRTLYKDMKTVFHKAGDIDEPLRLLVDRGYLALKGKQKSPRGTAEHYLVNPLMYKEKDK